MKRAKEERGQSLVEFALILPILVLFILGIIDFGFIFFNYLTVEEASRDAVRYAVLPNSSYNGVLTTVSTDTSKKAVSCDNTTCPAPTSSTAVVTVSWTDPSTGTQTVTPAAASGDTSHPADWTSPNLITVKVQEIVPVFDPIMAAIVGQNVKVTATTTMRSE